LLSIMLNFSPKIRLGKPIKVMVIKKICIYFVITYMHEAISLIICIGMYPAFTKAFTFTKLVDSRRQGVSSKKISSFPRTKLSLLCGLLALFINVNNKNNFAKILHLSDFTLCACGRKFESQRLAKSYTAQ